METYFTLHCLARSISSRVKHQIEHRQVKKAEHLHWTDQRSLGVLQGLLVWGQNQQGVIANTLTASIPLGFPYSRATTAEIQCNQYNHIPRDELTS